MTKEEIRRLRLKAAYEDMQKFSGQPYIEWTAVKGTAPYIEEYKITFKIRTYCARNKTMDRCTVSVNFPPTFPERPPCVKVVSTPCVYHPHWFTSGNYCPGDWCFSEKFETYIQRVAMTLQNDPIMINEDSPANSDAMSWYIANKGNKALFPSDKTELTVKRSFTVISRK